MQTLHSQQQTTNLMQIQVKLMGLLKDKTPNGGILELPDAATIDDALKALTISTDMIQVVSVNNKFERDFSQSLQNGDELMILAPVGGG